MVLPLSLAGDFLLFCRHNPKPCPLLEITEAGCPEPRSSAPGADIRTDLPAYHVFRNGEFTEETADIGHVWQDDSVGFLIGCSFSFERAMLAEGLPVRHIEEGRNVPMYCTNSACTPTAHFSGSLVVSMRPLTRLQAQRAAEITSRYPEAHGAPVHVGDPGFLAIGNLDEPDYGEPVTIY